FVILTDVSGQTLRGFRGSMAGLCPPLPTVRRRPRGRQRTARGRCRSLLLHRSGLAPPTPCRSPGALRVLPAPPRIHSFCRYVETRRKCPLTAGFSNASFESLVLRKGRRPISGRSLCGKKSRSWRRKGVLPRASPRSCRCRMRTRSEVCKCEEVGSGLGQTKPLKLQRPFGRRITQGGDADAARKPPFDGGLDQSRRDECHRYRHVDVTNTALLARGNG